jgi:elongation factor G
VPRIAFMNKMDGIGADFFESVKSMVDRLGANPVPIQIPIGKEAEFRGSIDLIEMKAIVFDDETLGAKFAIEDIPADLLLQAQEYREKMLESVAEFDDTLLEKYLHGEHVSPDEIKKAIRVGTILLKINPVLCGASFKNKGVQPLLDAVIDFLPAPTEIEPVKGIDPNTGADIIRKHDDNDYFSALAFKIMSDPFVGQLTYFRVYSGILMRGHSHLL